MSECQNTGCSISDQKNAQDALDASVKGSLSKIKNKIIVMSGKGGVGKTSVSVNLSIALANKGFKVGVMDVDLHGPDVPRMLGFKGMLDLSKNQKLNPMKYSENLKAVSIESLTQDKDEAIIWRGPIKHSTIRQFIGDVEWGELDYLIIDSPPGTGDEPLTVAQTIPDAKAIIVTTPQEISLADVRKSISFCKTVGMKILGLIENMSGFTCPHCGEKLELFGYGGGERTAKEAGLKFLGRIPFDHDVVACGDSGTSFQEKHKDSLVTKAFLSIADKTSEIKQEIKNRRSNTMKFAIPLADGKLTAHFGHCKEFALIDVEENIIKKKETLVPPPHEPGVLPKWLHEQGVNVIIAGGMGNKAQVLFNEQNIKVVTGAQPLEPEELINSYLNNALVTGNNLCDH
ncbi:MAG: P-loop NTPase [Deltaproteobacteria bacterium]|jgi:Mrp family chromosome partitioning ATPase/predicted Fe-Mo cluster-binding NifX family protein|nr:P-loop NTPase [Deltaproteobacteria bacterium]